MNCLSKYAEFLHNVERIGTTQMGKWGVSGQMSIKYFPYFEVLNGSLRDTLYICILQYRVRRMYEAVNMFFTFVSMS